MKKFSTISFLSILIFKIMLVFFLTAVGCKMETELPRNQELQLFHPHRADFNCQIESTKVPPIDAEADAWFLEARALEVDTELLEEERDYPKIVSLTRKASDRQHWKATLNLASLYLEGRDPLYTKEDAIQLVEHAMRLGVPAAYDRMGTYIMNGIIPGDASRAYAFWQKAAELGNPHAMTFLGQKLSATWDNPKESFWANKPVAIKMLECAFSQGDGDAAYHLRFEYAPLSTATTEQKRRALNVLQEGVKLGSSSCASSLAIDFDGSLDHSNMLAPFLDKARSERYFVLSKALDYSPSRRFPNLDKVLPLPPAALPKWDGKRETLLKAAMAIAPISTNLPSAPITIQKGRATLESTLTLQATGEITNARNAPFSSYWQPSAPHESLEVQADLANRAPGLYATGEEFDLLPYPQTVSSYGTIRNVVWERMLTIPSDHAGVIPRAAAKLLRKVLPLEPRLSCEPNEPCPTTGTWQPWLPIDHPLRHAVNQSWRQAWLTSGQPFPDPTHDWLLSLDKSELSWHLLDDAPPDLV